VPHDSAFRRFADVFALVLVEGFIPDEVDTLAHSF